MPRNGRDTPECGPDQIISEKQQPLPANAASWDQDVAPWVTRKSRKLTQTTFGCADLLCRAFGEVRVFRHEPYGSQIPTCGCPCHKISISNVKFPIAWFTGLLIARNAKYENLLWVGRAISLRNLYLTKFDISITLSWCTCEKKKRTLPIYLGTKADGFVVWARPSIFEGGKTTWKYKDSTFSKCH